MLLPQSQHNCRQGDDQNRRTGGPALAGGHIDQQTARHLSNDTGHTGHTQRQPYIRAAPIGRGEIDGDESAEPGLHHRHQEVQPGQPGQTRSIRQNAHRMASATLRPSDSINPHAQLRSRPRRLE